MSGYSSDGFREITPKHSLPPPLFTGRWGLVQTHLSRFYEHPHLPCLSLLRVKPKHNLLIFSSGRTTSQRHPSGHPYTGVAAFTRDRFSPSSFWVAGSSCPLPTSYVTRTPELSCIFRLWAGLTACYPNSHKELVIALTFLKKDWHACRLIFTRLGFVCSQDCGVKTLNSCL